MRPSALFKVISPTQSLVILTRTLQRRSHFTHFGDKARDSERLHNLPQATQLRKGKAVGWGAGIPGLSGGSTAPSCLRSPGCKSLHSLSVADMDEAAGLQVPLLSDHT